MHHPVFPTFPLFALYGKDVCIRVCVSRPGSSWRERGKKLFLLASTTPAFFSMIRGTRLPMFITKLPPRSPSQNQRISYSKSFSNLCAAQYHSFPQNRCLLLAELGLGVCLPSLSFKRFFCLPGGHLLFRPFHDLISRWQRVLLRFWARWELKFDPILPPSVFLNNH